jgi:hypothetical protein
MRATVCRRLVHPLACVLVVLACTPSISAAQEAVVSLHLPGSPFGVSLKIPGYDVGEVRTRPDGKAAVLEAANLDGMVLSMFLENEPAGTGARECRDLYRGRMRRSPLRMSEMRETQQDSLEVVRWMVRQHRGQRVMQQNANAYYGRGGVCLDVHLSKAGYTRADSAAFDAVLRSIRILPPEPERAGTPAAPIVYEANRLGMAFLLALQREGMEGARALLAPGTANEPGAAAKLAAIQAAFALRPIDDLVAIQIETYAFDGVEHFNIEYGRKGVTDVKLWMERRGEGPLSVGSVAVSPRLTGTFISLGPWGRDWP